MCSFGNYWKAEEIWKSNDELVVDEEFEEILHEDLVPEKSKII